MSLVNCPECQKEISDQAVMCPHCGYPMRGMYGYEYRSQRELFGLPLVHIISGQGFDPVTGRIRVAKGIIAVGPIAVGCLAMGGASFGLVSFGGAALGAIAFGGVAIGALLAVGGLAIGAIALGGGAIGYYAFGGGVWGVHVLGGNAQDPNLMELFKSWFSRGTRS
jgi:hypothetical protein